MKGLCKQQAGLQRGVTGQLPTQLSALQCKVLPARFPRLQSRCASAFHDMGEK